MFMYMYIKVEHFATLFVHVQGGVGSVLRPGASLRAWRHSAWLWRSCCGSARRSARSSVECSERENSARFPCPSKWKDLRGWWVKPRNTKKNSLISFTCSMDFRCLWASGARARLALGSSSAQTSLNMRERQLTLHWRRPVWKLLQPTIEDMPYIVS